MMKYIDAEKLLAEIKRLHKAHSGKHGCDEVGLNLEYLEGFIESFKQEPLANMIQWAGNNLKEVIDFTGKSPRFGEWFKSWEEYENYVHSHNDILKLFCEDGSHYEVPVGAWIVKTPDGYNVPSVAKFIHTKQEQLEDTENKQKPVVQWPNLSNCKHDCKTCFAKCFYRKEQNKEQQQEVALIYKPNMTISEMVDSINGKQLEVDLEKEIDAFFDKWDKNSYGCIFDENGALVTIKTIKGVVKHFLNARKKE